MTTTEAQSHKGDELNAISGLIVDSAFHVHKNLGPGLLEAFMKKRFAMSCGKGA